MGCKIFKNNTLSFFQNPKQQRGQNITPTQVKKKSANIPKAITIKIQTLPSSPPLINPSNHHCLQQNCGPIKNQAPFGNQNPRCDVSLLIKYKHESSVCIYILTYSKLYSLIKLQTHHCI